MPMVTIADTSGNPSDPATGRIKINFNPGVTPILKSTEEWSPGSWYADTAAWRADLGSPSGVGGTPAANAGAGDLFNNRFGFMSMADGSEMMAYVPTGNSLAIRLDSFSSPLMESFNYSSSANRWDQVFGSAAAQVLWNGSMWHNYFTLPADAQAGNYSATFEIFLADTKFSGGTGFAQYDADALAATRNTNFDSAFVTYNWVVVPEPSGVALLALATSCFILRRQHR